MVTEKQFEAAVKKYAKIYKKVSNAAYESRRLRVESDKADKVYSDALVAWKTYSSELRSKGILRDVERAYSKGYTGLD